MSDLIDRQAAIDAVNEWLKLYVINRTMSNITSIQDILRHLPSAQPEPLTLRVNRELTKEEYDKLMQDIKDAPIVLLPSAQPEIIRCKDCKHKHIENMVWTCPFGLPGGENFFCGYGAESYKGEQE